MFLSADDFFFRRAAAGKKNEKKCKIISGKRVIFRGFSVLYVKGVSFNQTKPIMKKVILVICVAVLGVVLPSCSRTADIDKRVDDATMRTLTINLDEIDLSSQLSAMRNSVSFEDVQKYVSRTSPQTKDGEKDYEIIPQVDEENDTIFYLVQYEKGWKLIAGGE